MKYKYTVAMEEVHVNTVVIESEEPMSRQELIDAACYNNEQGSLEYKNTLDEHGFDVKDSSGQEVR